MRAPGLLLLFLATSCAGDDDDGPPFPPEFESPDCAWEAEVNGTADSDDAARAAALAADGALVVGGTVRDLETDDTMWLARYSATGEQEWTTREYGAAFRPSIYALAVDATGRIGATGFHDDVNAFDFWVAEYEANGEVAWSMELDTGGGGRDACFSADGSLYVTGDIRDAEAGAGFLIWVGKFSPDGALLWSRSEGGRSGWNHTGVAVVCDDSGGVTVLGAMIVPGPPDSIGPSTQPWIRRFDAAGESVWTRQLGDEFENLGEGRMLDDPTRDGVLVTAGGTLYQLDRADGAIAAELSGPADVPLAADEGGLYIDGGFSVKEDPDCDNMQDDCVRQNYVGWAYHDYQGNELWRRAFAGVADSTIYEGLSTLAILGDRLAVTAAVGSPTDLWICYR